MTVDSGANGIRPVAVPTDFASLATCHWTSLGRADCDSRFTCGVYDVACRLELDRRDIHLYSQTGGLVLTNLARGPLGLD